MRQSITSVSVVVAALVTGACQSMPVWEERLRGFNIDHQLYVAMSGDTLKTIAERYQLSIAELRALNPGVPEQPAIGTKVRVHEALAQSDSAASRALFGARRQTEDRVATADATPIDALTDLSMSTESASVDVASADVYTSPTTTTTVAVGEPMLSGIGTTDDLRDELLGGASQPGTEVAGLSGGTAPVAPREEVISDADFDNDLFGLVEQPAAMAAVPSISETGWYWPTPGPVARGFSSTKPNRQGIDIAGMPDQDIIAASSGIVVYSGRDLSGDGNLVIIRHPNGLLTTYSHANNLFVAEDDEVQGGDAIASLGANAASESVLRFEIRRNGDALDPLGYLQAP